MTREEFEKALDKVALDYPFRHIVSYLKDHDASQRARIEALEEESRQWEKTSLVDMLKQTEEQRALIEQQATQIAMADHAYKLLAEAHEQQAKEMARLQAALKRLRNEVSGLVYLDEKALRETFGNTNVSIVLLRLKEAEELLKEEHS